METFRIKFLKTFMRLKKHDKMTVIPYFCIVFEEKN